MSCSLQEVLNCALTRDVHYTVANPTFHHWQARDKRYGLTFQSCHDANALEQGIVDVGRDLLNGQSPLIVSNPSAPLFTVYLNRGGVSSSSVQPG